jgi:hypothetical protein
MRAKFARAMGAATLVIVTAAGAAQATQVDTRQELKVGAHATIAVESDGGSVQVEPGPAGVVTVVAQRRAGDDAAARALPVTITLDGNTVHIKYRRAQKWGSHNESVDFHVTAPRDSKVTASTGGGSVAVSGMAGGGVDVTTGGGSVAVADVEGKISVHTGGGGIEMQHVGGTVDATTGGGSVSVKGALHGKNVVETGGGSIRVVIPGDSKLDVDASTGGGGAHNDFGLATDGDKWGPPRGFHGKIGDGSGGSLELHTGGGSISLSRS